MQSKAVTICFHKNVAVKKTQTRFCNYPFAKFAFPCLCRAERTERTQNIN